ncbi:MAG: PfkB family carbohydrate kinase [Bacteroidales bacterium]
MKKVIGIGNALVDIMTRLESDELLDSMSFPKGSMQLVDGETSRRIKESTSPFVESLTPGGSVANTIHGLAMLGAEAGFIGSVGVDSNGDFFERGDEQCRCGNSPFKRKQDIGGLRLQ